MKKDDWIVLVIIICIALSIVILIVSAKIKADRAYTTYKNSNGEEFTFRKNVMAGEELHKVVLYGQYAYNFRYLPQEVENISVEKSVELNMNRPRGTDLIYYTYDPFLPNGTKPDMIVPMTESSRLLRQVYNMNLSVGNTQDNTGNFPIITCANVSNTIAVIYMKLGEDKIYSENGCIIIQGENVDEWTKASDRFAYYLSGVILA